MTLHPIHSEFPYKSGIFSFFFIIVHGKRQPLDLTDSEFYEIGTPTGLCEKLKNPKYYISVTTGYGSHSIFLK